MGVYILLSRSFRKGLGETFINSGGRVSVFVCREKITNFIT